MNFRAGWQQSRLASSSSCPSHTHQFKLTLPTHSSLWESKSPLLGSCVAPVTPAATRRSAELHISHSLRCENACKGVQSVPVLYRDSQRQDDHEAGPVGAPGHWPARPVPTSSSKGASFYPTYAYDTQYRYA
jgi:hypothetical protein